MVTDFNRARDVLKARLDAVFAADAFAALYPDAASAPKVYEGFPASEPPFYAAVDEIADDPATSGGVSMGHQQVDFTLRVFLCAKHTDLLKAAGTLMCYVDAVIGSVMADPQLCMTVDNAFSQVEAAGTSAAQGKQYIAAASVGVRCTVYSECPAALAALVRQANEAYEEAADEG